MKSIPILNAKEKKAINQLLEEQWGCTQKLDYVYIKNTKNRIFFMNRDLEHLDMGSLRLSSVGLYIGELMHESEIRLSIEGSQVVGPNATKNIIEVTASQMRSWLKGNDLEISTETKGFVILKWSKDFLGCGRVKEGRIINYVPKTRRILAVD